MFYQEVLNVDRTLTELWCEKFEWFGPSPIEPFNIQIIHGPVAAEQGGAEAREKRQREPHRAAEPAEPSLPRLSKVGSI